MDHDGSRSYWIQKEAGGRSFMMNSHAAAMFGGDSWEEQAFAEDAAGGALGGGCVWPPRSYTCSFCRREFRSAQALGGHMNVHRRDRAKLKQQINNSSSASSSNNMNQSILESAASNMIPGTQYHDTHDVLLLHHENNPNHNIIHDEINNPNNTSFDLDHHLFSLSSNPPRPPAYSSSSSSILRPFTCNSLISQGNQNYSPAAAILFEPRKRFHHIQDLGNQETAAGCVTKLLEPNSTNSKKNIKMNHDEVDFTAAGKLSSSSLNINNVRKRSSSFHDEELLADGLMFKKRKALLIDDMDARYNLFPKKSNRGLVINEEVTDEGTGAPKAEVQHERSSPNSTLDLTLDLELRLGDKQP